MSIDLLRFVREKLCRSGLVRNQLIVIGINVAASLPLRRHLSWLCVHPQSIYLSRSLSLSLPLSVSTKSIQVAGKMITFLFMLLRFQLVFVLFLLIVTGKIAPVSTGVNYFVFAGGKSNAIVSNISIQLRLKCNQYRFGVTTADIEAS